MSNTDKRNIRRAGFYWNKDNVPYPSVTEILKVIDNPGLRYWYGQQIYLAVSKDPTINEKEALASPYKVSEKAADRGTAVHNAIESYGFGKKALDFVDELYQPYVDAFKKWVKDTNPKFIESEKTIFNHKHGYAGTLDAIIEIGGTRKIVDFKTNKDGNIYESAHIQTSAYIETEDDIDEGLIVCLAATGEYNQQSVDKNFEVFLAAKKIWEYKNKNKLKKVGYTNYSI
jgi:hypothetical protein